ncbi:MAG: hypothetical protein AABW82_01375 [Nanoarchaeota archaeon]
MTKALIFDSGTLINLAMNGLLYILPELKKKFPGKFLITKKVKWETVDKPINIQRFELEALRIQELIESGVLEMPEAFEIPEKIIEEEAKVLLDQANHYLQANGRWLDIVSEAEITCLALYDECERRGIEPIIAIDERTTRLLAEEPRALEELISRKLHTPAKLVEKDFKIFSKYKFIRSSELVYVAFKKNLLQIKSPRALEAALYATKFKGSSITWEEIKELKRLG